MYGKWLSATVWGLEGRWFNGGNHTNQYIDVIKILFNIGYALINATNRMGNPIRTVNRNRRKKVTINHVHKWYLLAGANVVSCLNFCLWQFLLNIEQTTEKKVRHRQALGSDVSIDWVEMVVHCVRIIISLNRWTSHSFCYFYRWQKIKWIKKEWNQRNKANKTVWNNHMHPFQRKSFSWMSNGKKSVYCDRHDEWIEDVVQKKS